MEEEVERWQEPGVVDDSKETALSRHNRADRCPYKLTETESAQRPALVQGGQKSHPRQVEVPPLKKLFVIVVIWGR